MTGSYELFLFRPKQGFSLPSNPLSIIETGEGLENVDQAMLGDFLLSLGPAIRFGAATPLGDQYIYEDEQTGAIEIMVTENYVVLGFSNWPHGRAERLQQVAKPLGLAMVARFGLVLFDPQRRSYIRASRAAH